MNQYMRRMNEREDRKREQKIYERNQERSFKGKVYRSERQKQRKTKSE